MFAADYPELEFTAPDLQAHETNTKLAYDIKASIENKLSEIGIMNFWNTPNLATDSAETQWQYMMKLPALAGKGHQASMQLPHKVTQSMKELTLAQWPGWYETQFEKLVASPRCKHEKLLSDKNTPAAGTCEGHAQDMLGIELYPDGVLGTFPERPTKKRRVGIPKGLEGYNVCVCVCVLDTCELISNDYADYGLADYGLHGFENLSRTKHFFFA